MICSLKSVRRLAATFALSCAFLAPYNASAVLFAPGESKAVDPFNFPGLVMADPLRPFAIDFGGGVTLSGKVQDRVTRQADGTLAFSTYIRDITGAAGSVITAFGRGSFFDPTLQVTWDPTSLGSATPSLGQRSTDGKTMTFFYDPGFSITTPTADGNKFVDIRTAETQFAQIGDMFIEARGPNAQFGSTKLSVFAPVPEPGTYVLMLAGIGMLVWSAHRRRAVAL